MKQRQRKFIGIFATVGFMILYSLAAMAIGGDLVVGRSAAAEIGFYLIAGVAWLPVVMWIIRWMARPDPTSD
jgi:hypothetical protein